MGAVCSKKSKSTSVKSAGWDINRQQVQVDQPKSSLKTSGGVTPSSPQTPRTDVHLQKDKEEQLSDKEDNQIQIDRINPLAYESDDEFYDGIPRYPASLSQKSSSFRSKQAATKVSEVSSRLGRAGSAGLGKAVQVLDTLGSSMTNLNSGPGFASAAPAKGNEIAIISFEIANTIVKGSNLMQSLSKRSMRQLKEMVLVSQGVQHLVSKDMDELLRIVAADKREELQIFSGEVVRFGNRCKESQWHNLDRYFDKISRELTPLKYLKEDAGSLMQQLMTLVVFTAELYNEFHALDRLEQIYARKRQEEGDSLGSLRSGLKSQRKIVKSLRKKSLWSKSMEEVMEKLVDIVHFLHLEIHSAFGGADSHEAVEGPTSNHQRLGPAGLSLHYANIILQIDSLVAKSSSMPQNTKDTLYQNLPPNIKSSLRSKLQSFHVKEELSITDIKAEMEKTLHWLVPVATNTAKAHHGFGWVGEWASSGSASNRKPVLQTEAIRIETFHHADKEKTEACILDLILWLHHLACQTKSSADNGGMKSPVKSTTSTTLVKTNKQLPTGVQPSMLTTEDTEMLQDVSKRKRIPGNSKSQDFDSASSSSTEGRKLSKSNSYSHGQGSDKLLNLSRPSSGVDFGIDKEKALDVIDRVDGLTIT
ncbi:hypothetical protein D8674_014804 [Pyrus ussuriensis x Pyrus communis]|uniref:DUF668 domain-containing protein n=1 Tax=Pyrus ussuriensis x Pyrus communis TaxID=2448454 RepID=A0A5N5GTI9_9ROSA|nr:hypothetical protein D8674_014804 [Pyrus ussuriensis x Pyrus communis]